MHTIIRFMCTMIEPLINYKPKSHLRRSFKFVDIKNVRVEGGKGGDGSCTFMHVYANAKAGPGGGIGGNGGHIIFKASFNTKSLGHLLSYYKAPNGIDGGANRCNGKNAEDLVLEVPLGTVFLKYKNKEDTLINQYKIELNKEGDMFVAARGGSGGKGNSYFVDAINQTPMMYERGAIGETISYIVEMKTIAHFGLIGFPNAGKSTLLKAVSRANPKVAPYPFTTLHAQLGVMMYSDGTQLRMADLPGLIRGSHLNEGLGYRFLRHAQRCILLIYIIDFSTPCNPDDSIDESYYPSNDSIIDAPVFEPPWVQFDALRSEVELYFSDTDNVLSSIDSLSLLKSPPKASPQLNQDSKANLSSESNTNNPLQMFYEKLLLRDKNEVATDETLVSQTNLVKDLNHDLLIGLNENFNPSIPKYKYIVLGTKFDKGTVCDQNLAIFNKKYPDVKVFPISAKNGHNIRSLMVELRKLYDIFNDKMSDS